MLHGTVITMTPAGIRIAPEKLEPIGIYHESVCWGVVVPDRHSPGKGKRIDDFQPHLVIAPFDIDAWPVLFRAEVKLQHDRLGTFSEAIGVLSEIRFNILSILATPSGHHHATVNVIGESDWLKYNNPVIKQGMEWPHNRTIENPHFSKFVHQRFAPLALAYSDCIEQQMRAKHAELEKGLLRTTFADDEPGVLISGRRIADKVPQGIFGVLRKPAINAKYLRHRKKYLEGVRGIKAIERRQHTPAVTCVWLKNLAFFWLYKRPGRSPLFKFNANTSLLEPVAERDKQAYSAYRREVSQSNGPTKAIATLDLDEHYMRVVASKFDLPRRTLHVNLEYKAAFDGRHNSTAGLQHQVYQSLTDCPSGPFNIRRVTMGTLERTRYIERGWLHLLVSGHDPAFELSEGAHEDLRQALEENVKRGAKADKVGVSSKKLEIHTLDARRVFLSTRLEWFKTKKGLKKLIDAIGERHGFRVLLGTPQDLPSPLKQGQAITETVVGAIEDCQAFLMLLPEKAYRDRNLSWVLFELGVATGNRIPTRICVQCDKLTLEDWKSKIGPHSGGFLKGFHLVRQGVLKTELDDVFCELAGVQRASLSKRKDRYGQ